MKAEQTNEFLTKLGNRIYTLRKERNLSQKDLSDLMFSEKTHIRKLEKGRRNATVSTLMKVCEALNISMKDLFNFD